MRIIAERPPNFDELRYRFGPAVTDSCLFAFGDRIYHPLGGHVPLELLAHEVVHCRRQLERGVDEWWDLYVGSTSFRLDEEVHAHMAEYDHLILNGNRHMGRAALKRLAARLSGPLYGGLCSPRHARGLIDGSLKLRNEFLEHVRP